MNVGDSCVTGTDYKATGSKMKIYPFGFFWNPFSREQLLLLPRYNSKGLDPAS